MVFLSDLTTYYGPFQHLSDNMLVVRRVLLEYVLRRGNGYFIYSTVDGVSFQPRDIETGPILLTLVRRS